MSFMSICLTTALLLVFTFNSAAFPFDKKGERGIRRKRKETVLHSAPNQQYAIIIGINDYLSWPPLEYAVSDAGLIDRLMKKYKFNITLLRNRAATRKNIFNSINRLQGKRIRKLFLFFAGHGHTHSFSGREKGYIIPVEGKRGDYDSVSISLEALKNSVMRLNALHVLLVFDSCYSGLALARGGITDTTLPGYLQEVDQMKSVQILTAGRKGDQAVERHGHGLFSLFFANAVKGEADADQDSVLTASEINQWIRPFVYQQSGGRQMPMYGHLLGEGEFLFINKKKESQSLGQRMKRNWVKHAYQAFKTIERRRGYRELRLTRSDPLFERILELIAGTSTLDVKSFILNTMNYGVPPKPLTGISPDRRVSAAKKKASEDENDRGVKLYWKYKKRRDRSYLDRSIQSYTRAIKLNPRNSDAYSNLSLAYFRKRSYRYAIWSGLRSIEHTDKRVTVASSLYNIALCFEATGQQEKSLIFYLAALSLREKGTKVYDIVRSKILKIIEENKRIIG